MWVGIMCQCLTLTDASRLGLIVQVLQKFFGNTKTTSGAAAAVAGAAGG